ncbi:MAG: flavin reductase family protein [Promethearchaeota archaeon]
MDKKVLINENKTLFPMPAAVISVGTGEEANLITLAYVGKVCMKPPIIAIGIHSDRYSYKLIEEHGEFIINYPSKEHLRQLDYCGNVSGRDINKWEQLGLTKEKATKVQVPMIKEFPWNMECKVVNKIKLGSHTCYFGGVVANHGNPEYLKGKNIDPDKLNICTYMDMNYFEIKSGSVGKYGFSKK